MRRHVFVLFAMLSCLPSCIFGDAEELPSELCSQYCDLAQSTCSGAAQLFETRSACVSACREYRDNGEDGAVRGNTVQCRIQHLTLAELSPLQHCPHGGPSGAGHCVDESLCGSYCAEIQETCSFDSSRQYNSIDECLSVCQGFRDNGPPGILEGNTIQCRVGFLFQAPEDFTPVQKCEEAGAMITGCADAPMSMPGMLMDME